MDSPAIAALQQSRSASVPPGAPVPPPAEPQDPAQGVAEKILAMDQKLDTILECVKRLEGNEPNKETKQNEPGSDY